MKPKTELRYSWIYNRVFDPKFTKKELEKLKKDCKKFEELYNKYINQILTLIEKHHSKRWKSKFIPVYIVSKKAPHSFSDPLTIKSQNNKKFMLILLAHELLHNNIIKRRFKNKVELHKYMEPICDKVILELPINLKKELKIFNKNTIKLAKKHSK